MKRLCDVSSGSQLFNQKKNTFFFQFIFSLTNMAWVVLTPVSSFWVIRLKTAAFRPNRRRTGIPTNHTQALTEDVRLPITQDMNEIHAHAPSTTGYDASVFLLEQRRKDTVANFFAVKNRDWVAKFHIPESESEVFGIGFEIVWCFDTEI